MNQAMWNIIILISVAGFLLMSGTASAKAQFPSADPVRQKARICSRDLITGFGFSSNPEAQAVLKEVITSGSLVEGYSGLSPDRFEILAAEVENALACEDDNSSKRYILYNPSWIKGLTLGAGTDWAKIAVLAHEVGHHALGHSIRGGRSTPKLELEADEFAGKLLAKMKASESQALAAYRQPLMCDDNGSDTHPPCAQRLAAVQRGWNNVKTTKPIVVVDDNFKQSFLSAVTRIADAKSSNFVSLMRDKEEYLSTDSVVRVPGADECTVWKDTNNNRKGFQVMCYYLNQTVEVRKMRFNQMLAIIRDSGWSATDDSLGTYPKITALVGTATIEVALDGSLQLTVTIN
jgi:hypothetical protein